MPSQTLKPLPLHNPRKPQGVPVGQIIAASLLLTYSLFPRLFIVGFWIFGSQIGNAFSSWILPALGFFVLPWTTLLYACMWAINSDSVSGWEWLPVVVGFLLDVWFLAAVRRLFQ